MVEHRPGSNSVGECIRWRGSQPTDQSRRAKQMQLPSTNLESIRRDIADRLRPTCAHMSDEEFEKMVARMALIEWKHLNDATPTSQMQSH
jgi:hypothetical protein